VNPEFGARLNCRNFLDAYSDYRDALLDEKQTHLMSVHLESCTSCNRYDRVLREGVQILKELEIEGSDHLPVGVVERFALDAGSEEANRWSSSGSGFVVAAAALVAALIAVVAGSPTFFADSVPELEIAPIVAVVPLAAPPAGRAFFPVPAAHPFQVAPKGFQALSRSLLYQYGGPRPARVIAAAAPQLD